MLHATLDPFRVFCAVIGEELMKKLVVAVAATVAVIVAAVAVTRRLNSLVGLIILTTLIITGNTIKRVVVLVSISIRPIQISR